MTYLVNYMYKDDGEFCGYLFIDVDDDQSAKREAIERAYSDECVKSIFRYHDLKRIY